VKSLYPRKFRLAGMGTKPNLTKDGKKTTENGKKAATYHVSMPKKVVDESKYKLVHSNHNKHDSFSLLSHVTSM
jgi:cbb3-type cytochrome oxidase cytochrome c subunit